MDWTWIPLALAVAVPLSRLLHHWIDVRLLRTVYKLGGVDEALKMGRAIGYLKGTAVEPPSSDAQISAPPDRAAEEPREARDDNPP